MRKKNVQRTGLMLELYIAAFGRYLVMLIVTENIFAVHQVIADKIDDAHLFFRCDPGVVMIHLRDITH